MTTVAFKGTPIHLSGQFPRLGQMAPHFCLVDSMLQDKNLEDFSYSKKLLLIVPSLETSVCSTCTKTFHSKILKHPHVGFFVISADLPFAQKRYCETETILSQNLHPLSMMRDKSFGKDYGVLMEDGPLAGLCTRAVLVLDAQNKIVYAELVPEITQEPNYERALALL